MGNESIKIRVDTTALACIFKYPDALNVSSIVEFLETKGFERIGTTREEVVTKSGIPIGEIVQQLPIIARKKDKAIEILYNPNASLLGFPYSSFITVRGTNVKDVLDNFRIISEYLSKENLSSDIALYEATLTGFVEFKNISNKIIKMFNLQKLSKIAELLQEAKPVAFRLRGTNPNSPKWFDLILDSALLNPNLSFVRFIIRYDDFNKYEQIEEILKNTIMGVLKND